MGKHIEFRWGWKNCIKLSDTHVTDVYPIIKNLHSNSKQPYYSLYPALWYESTEKS